MFSYFFINILFLKIWTKKSLFGQNFSFLSKNAKIFKNKKLIKKREKTFPRHMYSDGFGKFFVIFVFCFLRMLKNFWAKKSLFGNFSKIRFLAKNLTI